jgi:hypothetical protein
MDPNPLSLNEWLKCQKVMQVCESSISNLNICVQVKEANPSRCGKVRRGSEARRLCIHDDHITIEHRYGWRPTSGRSKMAAYRCGPLPAAGPGPAYAVMVVADVFVNELPVRYEQK